MRSSIVAFVPKYPELLDPDYEHMSHLDHIFGTGFIVGDSLIATNKHVIEEFAKLPKPESDPRLPVNAVFFTKTSGGMGICLLNVNNATFISKYHHSAGGFDYRTTLPDVGLVSVECTGLSKYRLVCDRSPVVAGTEIATAGFPLGSSLLAPNGRIERFGPVIQRGIVAAESPYFGATPHAYLIDVMIQGGASGSPVFRVDNGRVIGIVYAKHLEPTVAQTQDVQISIGLPTSFSYVVPSAVLFQLMDKAEAQMNQSIPTNAASIDEIIASMPAVPVDQMTVGRHIPKPISE
jgi:S1-C subfamily serine protease